VEEEETPLTLERSGGVREQPELLGQLVVGHVTAGFDREGNEAGTPCRRGRTAKESGAKAAVDVTDGEVMPDGFVAGDRLEGEAREGPVEVQVRPDAGVGLTVVAVGVDLARVEAGHERVAAFAHDVGAEETRRAT